MRGTYWQHLTYLDQERNKISEMLDPYLQNLEELQYIVNFWIHYFFLDLFRATFLNLYMKRWYRGKVASIVC